MIRTELFPRARDHFDWPLFIAAVLIGVLGVVNLYSSTSVYKGALSELYISQLYWLFAGGVLGALLVAFDYRYLERFAYVLYTFGVFTLILVFVLAKDVRGSARWIEFGSFSFQPSEFMKIFLILALAKYFHDDPRNDPRTLKDFAIPALLTAVPAGLILRQPDLGTSIVLTLLFLTIAMVTRIRWQSVVFAVGTVAAVVYPVYEYGLLGYQRARVDVFLSPESDLLGRGWHAHHSRVAIGNGGLFGDGFMKGSQNQFLFVPDQHTDFPFPVFAEEWGFVGSVLIISLYGFLALWSVRVAALSRDRFGAIAAIGCGSLIFWQAVINIGMACGVLPVVGITLPLFSYGGSSVTTVLLAVAILMSISMRRHAVAPAPERL